MVVDNCFGNAIAHYLQRLVAQVLGVIARIVVVGIKPTMVFGPFSIVQY